jgi:hypothetical protein
MFDLEWEIVVDVIREAEVGLEGVVRGEGGLNEGQYA